MNVPTPAGEVVLVDPRVHREDVVRRLLQLGVSSRTLRALLPAWEELIRSVAATGLAPGSDQPAAATSAELVT